MKYNVVFETRSRNAIGYFYPFPVQVEANNQEEAYRLAMEQCHARNLETRFPIRCEECVETPKPSDLLQMLYERREHDQRKYPSNQK